MDYRTFSQKSLHARKKPPPQQVCLRLASPHPHRPTPTSRLFRPPDPVAITYVPPKLKHAERMSVDLCEGEVFIYRTCRQLASCRGLGRGLIINSPYAPLRPFRRDGNLHGSAMPHTTVVIVAVAFSSIARILGECSTIHSLPELFSFFFLEVKIGSRTLIPLFMLGSVHSGSAS